MDDIKNEFSDLAWQVLVYAVRRQYAKTEDLMKYNGILIEEQILPTVKDVVEKMNHAALQTMLIDIFKEATRRSPTYLKAKGEMDSRIAKLITKQINHHRAFHKTPKTKVAK